MREKRIEEIRKGLHPLYQPYFDALCYELDDDWIPYSGFRSFVQQDALYMQGRTQPGKIVTHAQGGDSPHNWGCASDFTIFDQEGNPTWSHSFWDEYALVVRKIGLTWGGDFFKFPDRPHNELAIGITWAKVGEFYRLNDRNKEATFKFIERSLIK